MIPFLWFQRRCGATIARLLARMLPRCLVFDLDGCVWDPEMYELWGGGGAPFKPNKDGTLSDKAGPSGFWLKRSDCLFECCGSMTFWYGSGSAYPYL
jgi:hypothetical protein